MSLVFPPSLTPKSITWSLDPNFVPQESPSGFVARTARGVRKWSADLTMPPLTDEDAAIFSAFLTEAANHDGSFYLHNPGQELRGSFNNSDFLTNGTFDGTTGWSTNGATIREGSRIMVVENSGAAEGYAYQSVDLFAGQGVCFIADYYSGNATNAEIEIYDTIGAAVLASVTATASGRLICSAVATNTGAHEFRLKVNTTAAGNRLYYTHASAFRAGLVLGGSQTGKSLATDTWAASQLGHLKRGDMFAVMIDSVPSLHRLTRDLDTNSSGQGSMFFEPALPGSPADNAPIILRNPFCRMFIPGLASEAGYAPPQIASFSLSCRELVNR